MFKLIGIAIAATCISTGLAYPTFAQGPARPGAPAAAGGTNMIGQANAPWFARNLGISYVPVARGNGTFGLRLTAAPMPGSPASQLPLDAGDVILALDGQQFRNANDVANHVDQTTVDFFDAATNTVQRGNIILPSAVNASQSLPDGSVGAPAMANGGNQIGRAAQSVPSYRPGGAPAMANGGNQIGRAAQMNTRPQPVQPGISPGSTPGFVRPLFARNLGIYYVMVNNGNGTLGLRLTAAPIPGSPASQLPLDAGDVILALDNQRLTNVNDVANHFDQTTVDFFDAATNTVQRGNINLPSQNP